MVLITILKLVLYPLVYLGLIYVISMPMVMSKIVNMDNMFTKQRIITGFSFIYLMIVIVLESNKVLGINEGFSDSQVSVLRGYIKKGDMGDVRKTVIFLKKFGDLVKKDKDSKVVGQNLKEFANWLNSNKASPQEKASLVNALNNYKNGGDLVPSIMIENVVRSYADDKKMDKKEEGSLLGLLVQVYNWKNDIESKKAEERLKLLEKSKLEEKMREKELEEKQKKEAKEQVEVKADVREEGKEEQPVEKEPNASNTPLANDKKEQFANIYF